MEMFAIAVLAGLLVGVLSGLFGIGGGTIMVPLFRLAFGLPPIGATATSLFTVIPTSLSGLVKHVKNKTTIPKLGIAAGLAGAVMSPVGVLAASKSPGWAIMGATAAVLCYSSCTMFSKGIRKLRSDRAQAAGCPTPENTKLTCTEGVVAETFGLTKDVVWKVTLIGAFAGLVGGYVGVGGGFVMVPMFISVLGISMRLASGTSLIAVCILALPGAIEQAVLGNIHYTIGLAMIVGSMPGSYLGATLVKRVPEAVLRIMFACFLMVVAVILIVNEVLV